MFKKFRFCRKVVFQILQNQKSIMMSLCSIETSLHGKKPSTVKMMSNCDSTSNLLDEMRGVTIRERLEYDDFVY